MKKLREKEPAFKGEITAFLALIFILMLSVVGALIESASIQITKNRKRADTILALESVFAEYHREMLDQYDIFVHLGSSESEIAHRLQYYGASNMSHTLEKVELLTDDNGAPFYRQAVRYMKDWLGMEDIPESSSEPDFSMDDSTKVEEEEVSVELERMLEQEEAELPEENNPLTSVQKLKDTSLITLVAPKPEELSNRSISTATLPSARELQRGNYEKEAGGTISDQIFFVIYLIEHFSDMTDSEENHALLYEQEYLLGGHESDKENLEAVCEKILKIRMAANYVYLLTDTTKQAEAETMALALCSMLSVPAITQLVKHAILLAWAYGESIVDVRVLLKGKKVPAVKTAETWQLQLANLVKLGTEEEVAEEMDSAGGLSYRDYLKGLLLLEDEATLCMRGLDLIESNLQIKTDQCMTKAEIKSRVELRRGIQDSFTTMFGYQ